MNNNTVNAELKSGIYKITNLSNSKVYVGQSVNLNNRIYTHKYSLENNNHYNSLLQRAYNKYGQDKFTFEIIEKCDLCDLDEREIYWIAYYKSTNRNYGYNFESGGNENKTIHEETKNKLREAFKGKRLGPDNPMYGRKLTKERVEQIRNMNKGSSDLLTEKDVREIKMAIHIGISQNELSDMFNIKLSTINKIAKGHNWYWVLPQFNNSHEEQYKRAKVKMKETVLKLFEQGLSSPKIVEKTPYTLSEVQRVLKGKVKKITKERYRAIREDYEGGMTKKEIMKKYDICAGVFENALPNIHQKEYEERNKRIKELHAKGFKNKELAKMFGIHRTTVTDIVLGRVKDKKRQRVVLTEELENKILELSSIGYSQRKVAETLDITRNCVKKVIMNNKNEAS